MTNQVFLNAPEVIFTPGLQQRELFIRKLRVHITSKLGGVKSVNGRLYHNIKGPFNRIEVIFADKRLRLPKYGIVCGRNDARRRYAIQLFAERPTVVFFMPCVAITRRKGYQRLRCQFVH